MEDWIKELFFEEEPPKFDISKYSPETIRKIYKLDEPKIITFFKETLKVIAAAIAIILLGLFVVSIFTYNPPKQVVTQPNPVVTPQPVKPIDKPVVTPKPTEPITNIPSTDGTDTDFDYDYDYNYNPPSTGSGYNFFEDLLNGLTGIIFEAIGKIDIDELSNRVNDISTVIKDIESEESKAIINSYKSKLINIVNDNSILDEDTKSLLINLINDFNPNKDTLKNIILNGRENIEVVLSTISNSINEGRPLTADEIIELFNKIFNS